MINRTTVIVSLIALAANIAWGVYLLHAVAAMSVGTFLAWIYLVPVVINIVLTFVAVGFKVPNLNVCMIFSAISLLAVIVCGVLLRGSQQWASFTAHLPEDVEVAGLLAPASLGFLAALYASSQYLPMILIRRRNWFGMGH